MPISDALAQGFFPRPRRVDIPVISLGVENGASSIAASVLVPYTNTAFRYLYGVPTRPGTSFPNNDTYFSISKMVGYLDATNTAPVYDSNGTGVEFQHTGSVLEILVRNSGLGDADWIMVDNQALPAVAYPASTNRTHLIRIEFAGPATRKIRFETGRRFGGVRVAAATEITAPTTPVPPIVPMLGDSLISGVGQAKSNNMLAAVAGRALGFNIYNGGVGSTGIIQQNVANRAGSTQPLKNYLDAHRLSQFCVSGAAMGIVWGSQNDAAPAAAEYTPYGASIEEAVFNGCQLIVDAWVAANATAPLLLIGPSWPNDQPLRQIFRNRDAMQQTAMSRIAQKVYFIDQLRPSPVTGGASISAPGSDGPTGNSGIYTGGATGSDTAHPTAAGHEYRGLVLADQIRRLILTEGL